MGFSPLEGLMMATRAGTIDPDVPLHLILHGGMNPQEVRRMLSQESGLTALAGTTDMREAERRAEAGDARAGLALAVHDHRLAAGVAGMTAALGGLDAVVFTGGVGEGSARVRAETARRLAFMGLAVDPARNAAASGDCDVSAPGAAVRTLVVHAREELVIARGARRALAPAATREVAP
jgi:acetate kinase